MKLQKNLFNHFFQFGLFRYQFGLETLMKGTDFIFDFVFIYSITNVAK